MRDALFRVAAIWIAIALLQSTPNALAADAIVGPPCAETDFDTALAAADGPGGGTITFACGGSQTIVFTNAKQIDGGVPVTIDGGGVIELSGNTVTRHFSVDFGSTLVLANLTLADGRAVAGAGGAILSGGTLTLRNVTIRNCQADLAGGAISSLGPLTLEDSLLEGNLAPFAGALYAHPLEAVSIAIRNTTLRSNSATGGPTGSPFDGCGGAIAVESPAVVSITGGEISGNTARVGGGLCNGQAATLHVAGGAVIRGNSATGGGANFPQGGGVINAGTLTLNRVTVEANTGFAGAGLFNSGSVTITESTVANNRTASSAPAPRGLTPPNGLGINSNDGSLAVRNSTITGNGGAEAVLAGGGIAVGNGTAVLEHVTIAGNLGSSGAGLYIGRGAVTLRNVLLANEGTGGNCALGALGEQPTSAGNNLASDSDPDCGLLDPTDRSGVAPQLSVLGDWGGPTQTMRPEADSPAVDAGACLDDVATDQRGVARPAFGCDIGAVERVPSDVTIEVRRPRGRLLRLRDTRSGSQRLAVVLKDASVDASSPCETTGEVAIQAPATGLRARRYPLAATAWKTKGRQRTGAPCVYRSPVSPDGTITVRIKPGKGLVAKVARADLAVPLTTDPRPLRIEVRHGDRRHCVEFGGKGPFVNDRSVVSRLAPSGGACPGEP